MDTLKILYKTNNLCLVETEDGRIGITDTDDNVAIHSLEEWLVLSEELENYRGLIHRLHMYLKKEIKTYHDRALTAMNYEREIDIISSQAVEVALYQILTQWVT